MDRERKLGLIQRSLGLKHKIKVHESMKSPETHEELSASLLARWELEDELRAIEGILEADRDQAVAARRKDLLATDTPVKKKPKK